MHASPKPPYGDSGPAATIGKITAQAEGDGTELELLSGTPLPRTDNDRSTVRGALGKDRSVNLRWQSRVTRQERRALLIANTSSTIHINPTEARYHTTLAYDILQGNPTNLTVRLPKEQSITKIEGQNIRDWRVTTVEEDQTLTIDFVQPQPKAYTLAIHSEQAITQTANLFPPEPRGVGNHRRRCHRGNRYGTGLTPGQCSSRPSGRMAVFRPHAICP